MFYVKYTVQEELYVGIHVDLSTIYLEPSQYHYGQKFLKTEDKEMSVEIKDLGIIANGAIDNLQAQVLNKDKFMVIFPILYSDLSTKMKQRVKDEIKDHQNQLIKTLDPLFVLMNDVIPDKNVMEIRAMLNVEFYNKNGETETVQFPIAMTSIETQIILDDIYPIINKAKAQQTGFHGFNSIINTSFIQ